jgi:HAD superfamily hydrolase (TIGR01484 family)
VRYKAIIFDLDGTAIPNAYDAMPSPAVTSAIAKGQPKLKLAAATGRPITNAKPILDALKLTDPCVIAAGTQVINPQTGEILWQALLDDASVEKILEICRPYSCEVLMNNELLGEGRPAAERQPLKNVNVMYAMEVTPSDCEQILAELNKVPGISASALLSWTGRGLDIHISHREATKEHAVGEALKMMGVLKEEAIGVGDNDNDVHLFNAVGLRVAMGNATDKLKALADKVIESVDDDGLAKLIEQYSK